MEIEVGFRARKSDCRDVMPLLTTSLFAILLLASCTAAAADTAAHLADTVHVGPYATETEHQRNDRMAWWREARFGLFIHWGVYAVPAGIHEGEQIENIGEWIMHYGRIPVDEYKRYSKQFNPVNYDPDAWVRMAKEAGMKYIVITAKHHDGFALFDTAVSDWDAVDSTPYGRDLLKPLAEAAQRHGIKLGFYYSQAQDWIHPGGATWAGRWDPTQDGDMDEYLRDIAVPQVRELLSNYGEISILWWDTPIDMTAERAAKFDGLTSLQPGIIFNNRLLYGEDGAYGDRGDLRTPEQHIPATGLDYDWEACQTMNKTWGYKSNDSDWKSSQQLIRNLVDSASKGGNYLLNVGPMANGEIPKESVERLRDIGMWMEVNSSSIYGTTASPFVRLPWGRATKKEYSNATDLFLHVFDWPEDGRLRVDGLRSEVNSAYFLADFQKPIQIHRSDSGIVLHLPDEPLDATDTVIVLKVKGELDVERILPGQDADGFIRLKLDTANLYNPAYGGEVVVHRDGFTKPYLQGWTDFRSRIEWLIKVDSPGEFDVFVELAADKPSGFSFKTDADKLSFTVVPTGSEQVFQDQLLGTIHLSQPESSITIQPIEALWNAISIRSVTLKPVASK